MKKLYVGGLPFSLDSDQLDELLSQCGTVTSARVITDRMTNTSRGFGFVEMSTDEEAQRAVAELNGKPYEGRTLTVDIAKPQRSRDGGGRSSFAGDRIRY